MGTTVCRKCGETIPGGTLLTHERTAHPAAPVAVKRPRTCYRPACKGVYGPHGHVPGVEGPHAY